MATPSASNGAALESSAAAIRMLAARGYEATTAEDLADAVGMSRSTFFRRFGSKDEVIFSDHDHALARLESFLADTALPVPEALAAGTADVLRLLIRDPEAARLRLELMRRTPALRDRELIITHRYERVFVRYLRERVTAPGWVVSALAAGIVAVHNRTLRDWLRGELVDAPEAFARDARRLCGLFREWLAPGDEPGDRRVLVAVYDAAGAPEAVLDAVSAQLGPGR
ncbi:TetR/AcrR family transcriptional regulator [Leucobacter allii]|uniref:TetR/AcrR family transcriptional regulator n=1 Tax=Leucobacter allii TaxID=2932247 RepID=UPI001FCF825F|nr:TetR/AcrR family transcriptional regulator [Leucobacter allii]UOR00542.1 TetR/AcrR family transcriptional regulator [Leucobacter allii]